MSVVRRPPQNLNWDTFLARARARHGDRFDYSEICREDYLRFTTKHTIPVICRRCGLRSVQFISAHLGPRSGCRGCAGTLRLTLDYFLVRAREMHGDKYDYSEITPDHIKNSKSQVPVTCRTCGNRWNPRITNHINTGTGCPNAHT